MTRDFLMLVCRLALATCFVVASHGAAHAQTTPPAAGDGPFVSNLQETMLRDLPSSDNLFSFLETTEASVTSDRFYGGGLNVGRAARVGAFLSSWTQTQYRVGDVNITAPDGSGSPFLFPTLSLWNRVSAATAFMPAGASAPGLAVSLEPRMPSASWTRVVDATFAGGGMIAGPSAGAPAPAIQTLTAWKHAAILASGPVIPNRLGLVAAVDWNESSQVERAGAAEPDGRATSIFAHAVFTPDAYDSIRTVGWFQRTQAPFLPTLTALPSTAIDEQAFMHLQSTWERSAPGLLWRLFGSYSNRSSTRSPAGASGTSLSAERLTDGPIPLLADSGDRSDHRWSAGLRASPTAPPIGGVTHALQFGADLAGEATRVTPFAGSIGELVDGTRARMWTFTSTGVDARRHETSLSAFVSDRIQIGGRATAEVGIAYDGVSGSADGAARGIGWNTLLPNASIWWAATASQRWWIFAEYRRAADALTLDTLAYGDPAAPTGTVSLWTAQGAGPLIARVGPGTGGNPAFSAIDASLNRPTTHEVAVGIESRPFPSVRVRLAGILKHQRDLLYLVNTGVPASSYTSSTIVDGRPGGDVLLPVYNRLPSSFGRDQYLLKNASPDDDTFAGLILSGEVARPSWSFLFGATASQTDGLAANRGFHVTENDPGLPGEVFADPNAGGPDARGRLFFDRAFTIKLASVHHFPHFLDLGVIARYQDGQPFSRVTVVPDLNQGTDFVRAYPAGDSRFTFTGTLDVRLQKGFAAGPTRVDAIFDVHNLFNLGYEVEERVVTGPGFRTITAIQPPMALHLGFRVTF